MLRDKSLAFSGQGQGCEPLCEAQSCCFPHPAPVLKVYHVTIVKRGAMSNHQCVSRTYSSSRSSFCTIKMKTRLHFVLSATFPEVTAHDTFPICDAEVDAQQSQGCSLGAGIRPQHEVSSRSCLNMCFCNARYSLMNDFPFLSSTQCGHNNDRLKSYSVWLIQSLIFISLWPRGMVTWVTETSLSPDRVSGATVLFGSGLTAVAFSLCPIFFPLHVYLKLKLLSLPLPL